jgi:hypothetical protein
MPDPTASCQQRAEPGGLPHGYWQACRLAQEGKIDEARRLYAELEAPATDQDSRLRALIRNDLAALTALERRLDQATPAAG